MRAFRETAITVALALLAGKPVLLRFQVHVWSFLGVWVLQVKVLVMVVDILEYTVVLAFVFVVIDVVFTVTLEGVVVDVLMMVVEGITVTSVTGDRVVLKSLVIVELIVVDGVLVTLKIAIGVTVIVV